MRMRLYFKKLNHTHNTLSIEFTKIFIPSHIVFQILINHTVNADCLLQLFFIFFYNYAHLEGV